MKIDVVVKGSTVTDVQRESVTQCLLFAISRFSRMVEHVTVRLSHETNPLGGVDTRCRMRARLRFRGSVLVETVDGSAAIDRAVTRLAERIAWTLGDGGMETDSALIPSTLPFNGLAASPRRGRPRRRAGVSRRRNRT